jgi:hypothetical protein
MSNRCRTSRPSAATMPGNTTPLVIGIAKPPGLTNSVPMRRLGSPAGLRINARLICSPAGSS